MSLLEKLWDDTLAGPRPENGLGKLRKKPVSSNLGSVAGSAYNKPDQSTGVGVGVGTEEVTVKVTRSIMIVKPPQINTNITLDGTPPASPAGTPPVSPFASGSMGREAFSLMRRKSLSDAYVKANKLGGAKNRGPPFNDV